jgi:hypothetical protein
MVAVTEVVDAVTVADLCHPASISASASRSGTKSTR